MQVKKSINGRSGEKNQVIRTHLNTLRSILENIIRMRNLLWKRKALLLVVFTAVLPMAELILRVVQYPSLQYYRNIKLLHQYNASYLVGLKENQNLYIKHFNGSWEGRFTTNSLGYRGSREVIPGTPQIVCLGDSIVMGFGVSDSQTFCHLLDGIVLNQRRYQSQNLGVDAFGSRGSYLRLTEATARLPSIRIALFFVSPNDFTIPEELRRQGILPDDENEALHLHDEDFQRNFHIQFEMTRYSYLLQALKLSYEQLKLKWFMNKRNVAEELNQAGMGPGFELPERGGQLLRYLRQSFQKKKKPIPCERSGKNGGSPYGANPEDVHSRNYILSHRKLYCPQALPANLKCMDAPSEATQLPPLPEVTRSAYDDLIKLSKEKGFTLIPVFLPIQNEEIRCLSVNRYHSLGNYSIRAEAYFRKMNIPYIDLSPFASEMCGEPLLENHGAYRPSRVEDYYIPGDGHLTVPGNAWVARNLKKELEKMARYNAF